MNKPLFSIVLIAKNEQNTIGRCLDSLKEFIDRGGEVVLGDTGSTDNTVEIAKSYGCVVKTIDANEWVGWKRCGKINDSFVDATEPSIMPADGVTVFNFAEARNKATSYASNDFIISLDCDEVYTNFNIDYINGLVESGVHQLDYMFIYSHKPDGSPELSFRQSKAFDRRELQWVGIIHEVLLPIPGKTPNKVSVPDSMIYLEHWQEPGKETRNNYIIGLAYDHYKNPTNDRHAHYLAREFMYRGMYRSAIKMFDKHIEMEGWAPETAQSMIYRADCTLALKEGPRADLDYLTAFTYDPLRNMALLRIASFYMDRGMHQAAIPFAEAAARMTISTHFYDEQPSYYNEYPYAILYQCYGWTGQMQKAQEAILKCISVAPYNKTYYSHLHYYFDLPTIKVITPHVSNVRQEGYEKCIKSITSQAFPQDKIWIETCTDDGTVPEKVNKCVDMAPDYDLIVFAANDMYFDEYDFIKAVVHMWLHDKDLIAFNTGPVNEKGYLCEHFMIKTGVISTLSNGQLFDERFHHAGVDDWLWAQMDKRGRASRCEVTNTTHNHFSRGGKMDELYEKGWSMVEQDRATLDELLKTL